MPPIRQYAVVPILALLENSVKDIPLCHNMICLLIQVIHFIRIGYLLEKLERFYIKISFFLHLHFSVSFTTWILYDAGVEKVNT